MQMCAHAYIHVHVFTRLHVTAGPPCKHFRRRALLLLAPGTACTTNRKFVCLMTTLESDAIILHVSIHICRLRRR